MKRTRKKSHPPYGPLRGPAGFTLIELLVSLCAGLIISLSIFAISKDATETFHEEARMATAEMTVRFAAERIRADLMRASFMATPNIWTDHQLAYPVNAQRVPGPAPLAIQQLAGIRLLPADPSIQALSIINGFWERPVRRSASRSRAT